MKRFNKIYLEISNICNLKCAFCPGTKRKKKALTEEEFSALLPKLRPYADFLYFHLMGEPLCHPRLSRFLELAGDAGFKVILTTNGTLLKKQQETLLTSPALHKVNISLHAFEANDLAVPFDDYLRGCFEFGQAAQGKKIVVYRLWNQGGADEKNSEILRTMEHFFPHPWKEDRRGVRIGDIRDAAAQAFRGVADGAANETHLTGQTLNVLGQAAESCHFRAEQGTQCAADTG